MKFAELLAKKNRDIIGAEPVTAAFLGDSVTHGCFECYIDENGNVDTVFERGHSYAAIFAEIVSVLYPRAQLNLINAGTSGGTAALAVKRLERDVLRFSPDLLVVNFALNDSGAGDAGLPDYRANLREIFRRAKASGAEVILLTPNPMCYYASAQLTQPLLHKLAEEFSVRSAEGVLDRYVVAAKEVAAKEGVPVCDCYEIWKNLQKNGVDVTALLANRLNHPSREMHYLFAFKLAEMIFGRETV